MSRDLYGAVNRHYGSEPDSERDEDAVTEWALALLDNRGTCWCGHGATITDEEWEAGKRAHAATCTPLRERVVARMERDRE